MSWQNAAGMICFILAYLYIMSWVFERIWAPT